MNTDERCLSLCSPRIRQRIQSSAHKDYCRRTWGRGSTRCHAQGARREARPGQSMPGSEELEEGKNCQHCIINEGERKGREGRGESRKNMAGLTRYSINRVNIFKKKKKGGTFNLKSQKIFHQMRSWAVFPLCHLNHRSASVCTVDC